MIWEQVVPALLVGGFVGWLFGVVLGHSETQQKMEKQERKMHALLAHLHRGQLARLEEMDLIMGALKEPGREQWYWESWLSHREAALRDMTDDDTGFFAEMYRDQ